MMGTRFADLKPQKVFEFFEDLTRIPRGSGNEAAVSDYLVEFASRRGLIAHRDALNNVTILKPATSGMEDKDTVILQSHMDMVCVKDDDVDTDLTKDPIDAYVEGDYIKAKGTSLGADDGIGIALILAVLDSSDVSHPMIEAVFTTDEEIGLGGAAGYDVSRLKGKRLINIDTEEENHLVIGCAGGIRCALSSKCKNKKIEGSVYEIGISGLTGGHSGVEIDKGGANANVLMARLLGLAAKDIEFGLGSFAGGTKDNAITTSASATIILKKKQGKALEKLVKSFADTVLAEYKKSDPGFVIKCKDKGKGKLEVMSTKDMTKLISLINVLPSGVIKMSQIADMVETSANIGIVNAKAKGFTVDVSLRSNSDAALEWMIGKVETLAHVFEVQYNANGRYPAWECCAVSDFAQSAKETYEKLFDRKIEIITIHAGLECALFSQKIKGLDAISIGPDLFGVHSTAEKLSISSTAREWEYLQALLKL